jgi:hypothetical protein
LGVVSRKQERSRRETRVNMETIAVGLDTPILAYNGESPGPMIDVT